MMLQMTAAEFFLCHQQLIFDETGKSGDQEKGGRGMDISQKKKWDVSIIQKHTYVFICLADTNRDEARWYARPKSRD